MVEKRKSKVAEKRERKAQEAENKKPAIGYSIKLSDPSTAKPTDGVSKAVPEIMPNPSQASFSEAGKKKPTPEQLEKMKQEFLQKMRQDPKAMQQMQGMMKQQIKSLPMKQKITKFALMFSMEKLQTAIVSALKSIDNLIGYIVKKDDKDRNEVLQKARSPILFGMWITIITFCIFGVWAGIAPLDSASHASGIVVVDSSRRIIQHKEGGIVEKIFVKDGDKVKKDDPLIELNNATLKPQLDTLLNRRLNYRVWLARLKAEKNNSNQINLDQELLENIQSPEINKIVMNQQSQFDSRRDMVQGQLSGLDKKIEQHNQEIVSQEAQLESTKLQLKLTKEQVVVLTDLFEKGLAQKPRLIEQQSREAQLIAAVSGIESKIINTRKVITELEIEKENVKSKFSAEINREIREVSEKLDETKESIKGAEDQFTRLLIKSPINGTVSKVQMNTIGGVVGSGMNIMTIIPDDDNLVIDAFVRPQDIDSVYVGLSAKVRISAFKSRSTGPLDGIVTSVSPDLTEPSEIDKVYNVILQQQQGQGGPMYKVKINVDKEQLKKISKYRDYELYPGMQADVAIVTGERTLLQYLLDPVTSTFWHAFTEK